MGGGAANGASGFKLIGTLVGAFAHSRVVATGFGAYGAAMSVYSHFLARGRDVVYPKDMSMVLEFGTQSFHQSGVSVLANDARPNHGGHLRCRAACIVVPGAFQDRAVFPRDGVLPDLTSLSHSGCVVGNPAIEIWPQCCLSTRFRLH
jgi:hypothetical protein